MIQATLQLLARRSAPADSASAHLIRGEIFDKFPVRALLSETEELGALGYWKWEVGSQRVQWTPGVFAIHDLMPAADVKLDSAIAFYPPHHRPAIEMALDKAVQEGEGFDLELDFISARGQQKRIHTIGRAERVEGVTTAVYGLFQDITRSHSAEKELRSNALTDPRSGLPNRRHLRQFFTDLRLEEVYPGKRYALALVAFSQTQLAAGQPLNDAVLEEIVKRLRADWLRGSFVASMSPREMAVLIHDPQLLEDLEATGQRLLQSLSHGLDDPSTPPMPLASIGIASVEEAGRTISQVLSTADSVLYMARRGDRGGCVIARDGDIFMDAA